MAREYEYGETSYAYKFSSSGFSVGAVLSRSFSVLFKHPFVFIGLSFMAQIPGILLVALVIASMRYDILPTATMAVSAVNGIFGLVVQGAIAYGVYEVLMRRGARFGAAMSRGLARVISLIFAVLCCFIFMALIAVFMTAAAFILKPLAIVALIIGVIVMIVLWCKWSVFVPACVVERLGPIECLNRSSNLTKGLRLKIFGLYLLCFILIFVMSFVSEFIQSALVVPLIRKLGSISGAVLFMVIQQLLLAIPIAFLHTTTAASYYGLRETREGVSIEKLANVFD